jgi:hypothetical protein
MFLPNTFGFLQAFSGFNSFAEPEFGPAKRVPCAIVHLNKKVQHSSVRADSSGSRGSAEEFFSVSKILFPAHVVIANGYKFKIGAFTLKAVSIEPRYNVRGTIDHYEVEFEQWM